jgi:hypothetical protein
MKRCRMSQAQWEGGNHFEEEEQMCSRFHRSVGNDVDCLPNW